MSTTIESRTLDGRIFVAAEDVTAALRERAAEVDTSAEQAEPDTADAWRCTAEELRQRAEALDFAAIVHVSED